MVFNTNILAGSGGQAGDAFSPVGLQLKNSATSLSNYIHGASSVNATVSSPFSFKAPDGKKATIVIWFHPTDDLGSIMHLIGSAGGTNPEVVASPYGFFVRTDPDPNLQVLWQKAASGYGIDLNEPIFIQNQWNCFMFSFNVSSSDKSVRWYHNDADQGAGNATDTTYRFGSASGAARQFFVGAKVFGGQSSFAGAVAEVYYAPNQFVDFDIESNRRLFLNADGTPVDLGSDGSTPTGTSPMIYLSLREGETADQFAVNRGSGADLSVVGNVSIFADPVSCSIA